MRMIGRSVPTASRCSVEWGVCKAAGPGIVVHVQGCLSNGRNTTVDHLPGRVVRTLNAACPAVGCAVY